MKVELFDFELPESSIALRPANPRDSARMLVVRPDADALLDDQIVSTLPGLLQPGDALVFNDTKVIPAQLEGFRQREGGTGSRVSVNLHMRLDGARWKAFARPAKRLKAGDRISFGYDGNNCLSGVLDATVEEREDAEITLKFDFSGPVLDEAIMAVGHIPLPPYIAAKRDEDERDREDYQTIYAREEGAVAAPTAGLHFTPRLMEALEKRGIEQHFVTLHVGAGTFLPVKADDTADHKMHFESGTVSAETADALNAVRARGGRIVSVGTTSLRLLESSVGADRAFSAWSGATDIFITPGYAFNAVDVLMTNFHLPKSTLFMLVSAFAGLDNMHSAYRHAILSGYRFYSYGDSSLLFRKNK